MTNQDNITASSEKRNYTSPDIECILMDKQISLQLDSNPMEGPGEAFFQSTTYNNQDPFQTT